MARVKKVDEAIWATREEDYLRALTLFIDVYGDEDSPPLQTAKSATGLSFFGLCLALVQRIGGDDPDLVQHRPVALLGLLEGLLVGGPGHAEALAGGADHRRLDLLRAGVAIALRALRTDPLRAVLRVALAATPGDGRAVRPRGAAHGGGGRTGGRRGEARDGGNVNKAVSSRA